MNDYDLIIRNGTVVDGSGGEPYRADVAVRGDRIVAVGSVDGRGREEIDASGLLVTPGFVDVHTHFDGQVTWSDNLQASSLHGVTTVVIGNCGVGFAPCRPRDREALVNVMEGVEDIPEAVMAEGLPWNWETFPDYLDALAARQWDIDVAAYLPHSPLRVYVMGERGLNREPATETDLARMEELVTEAMAAGAMGFSTSRTLIHRRGDGEFIPSYDAHDNELIRIAETVGRSGRGVLQIIPNLSAADAARDIALLIRMAGASNRPVAYSLAQWLQDPDGWRRVLDELGRSNAETGTRLIAQFFPRPMGIVGGLDTSANPFSMCPSYLPLADLPLAERVAALRDPALRAKLLAEPAIDPNNPMFLTMRNFDHIYRFEAVPDYEPSLEKSVGAMARRRGISAAEMAYELLLEDEGRSLLFAPFANFCGNTLDATLAMMRDPYTVASLGDGGAHYGFICDASYPTTMLAHWTRDRDGERVSLPWAIKALAADTADLVGMSDRGRIEIGKKADLNVIDYERLCLYAPRVVADLPGGGKRMTQAADGYCATVVSGVVIQRDGTPTAARPGRLVRGAAAVAG